MWRDWFIKRWRQISTLVLGGAALVSIALISVTLINGALLRREALNHSAITLADEYMLPVPPFAVKSQLEALPDYISDQVKDRIDEAGCWIDTYSGGTHYVAFLGTGLLTDRDIYVGVDRNGDNLLDAVYPSGLQDEFGLYGAGERPRGKLQLSVSAGSVTIKHHQLVEKLVSISFDPKRAKQLKLKSKRIESTLTLDELTLDSDGDGLTDISESLLWCDPANSDTDGDGMPDAQDASPNVNSAGMSNVERGVGRALAYFFTTEESELDWWKGDETNNPWQARYMLVYGCDRVAFSGDPSTYGVCLAGQEQRDEYYEHVGRSNGSHDIAVQWMHRDMSDVELYRAFESSYYGSERISKENLESLADTLRKDFLRNSECVVLIDFRSTGKWAKSCAKGYRVKMIEVDGEYYPVSHELVWIS